MIFLFILFVSTRAHAFPLIDSQYVHQVASCEAESAAKQVYFIKQWHLPSKTDTSGDIAKSQATPQFENQKAIYEELDHWIDSRELGTLFAEGCAYPREIRMDAPEKFNGWAIQDLSARAKDPTYPDIVTNVAFKLEAKWKDRLHVHCGDDSDAMKKNLLAFSDARGIVGYLTRLEQYRKDPERAKIYLDGVIELYHLPARTTVAQAIRRLDAELKKSIDAIEKWIEVRNEKLVEAIAADPAPVVAVVFGGAHASGVRQLLEKRGFGCVILEPKGYPEGYKDDETEMLARLKELVGGR